MALVNDPNFSGLAKQLYQHALINPLGPGAADPAKNAPSDVDKLQFADAMLDVTGLSAATPAAAAQAPGPEAVAALTARMAALSDQVTKISDPQIRQLLQGMIARCGGDMGRLKADLASWLRQRDGSPERRLQAAHAAHDLRHRAGGGAGRQPRHHPGRDPPLWGETGPRRDRPEVDATIPSSAQTQRPSTGPSATGEQVIRRAQARWRRTASQSDGAPGHFLDIEDDPGTVGSALGRASRRSGTAPSLGSLITAVAALFVVAPFLGSTRSSPSSASRARAPAPMKKRQIGRRRVRYAREPAAKSRRGAIELHKRGTRDMRSVTAGRDPAVTCRPVVSTDGSSGGDNRHNGDGSGDWSLNCR